MYTTSIPRDALAGAYDAPTDTGPLLVATDGTGASDGALVAARLLAEREKRDVAIIAVSETLPLLSTEMDMPVWTVELERRRRATLVADVDAQLSRLGLAARGWSVTVREGSIPMTIAGFARERRASLVLAGIGQHAISDRLFGSETALQLLRVGQTPVLALPPSFAALPRRALIATDFSAESVRAARVALRVLRADATVILAHVVPKYDLLTAEWAPLRDSYQEALPKAFATTRMLLDIPGTMTVEEVTLHGTPGTELLRFADASGIDLIVAGTHGHGFFSRLVLGSVATRLVRGARCAVLVAPPAAKDARAAIDEVVSDARTVFPDPAEWPTVLQEFTRRNAARDCTIEVDDPGLGAQSQASEYPFLGAAYDRRDAKVELMFGEMEGEHPRHLTREIGGVTGIGILRDARGRDRLLRIAHDGAQTLVAFTPK